VHRVALVEMTGMVEVLVRVWRIDVVAHVLALEQARVEVIVRALDELDERRGLGDVRESECPATREGSVECWVEVEVERLRFAGARAAEPNGGGEQAAQAEVQERSERFIAIDAERARDVAERGREMAFDCAGLCDIEAARGDIE
jgi:hypothetical protein